MALSFYPAPQRTGRRARIDALYFRLQWRLIAFIVVPVLSFVLLVLIELLNLKGR
jgi:hypothetical protein